LVDPHEKPGEEHLGHEHRRGEFGHRLSVWRRREKGWVMTRMVVMIKDGTDCGDESGGGGEVLITIGQRGGLGKGAGADGA